MIRIATLAAAALVATGAAADTYDAEMTGYGTSGSTVTPLSEALVVVDARSSYDRFETADPDNPFAGATGPCFGAMLVKRGQVSGGGQCLYTDPEGGTVVVRWTAQAMTPEGLTLGTWSIEGGTGKWAGAAGGGDFTGGVRDGQYSNEITGAVTLP